MKSDHCLNGGQGRTDEEMDERGQMALAAYVVIAAFVVVAVAIYLLIR